MAKRTKKQRLKDRTWKLFSEWIRRKAADKKGNVKCVTCTNEGYWKSFQAGHFIPGRRNSILFVEENCHVQCYACNVCNHGNLIPYYEFMENKYGKKKIKELKKLKERSVTFNESDYETMIEQLKLKIKELGHE